MAYAACCDSGIVVLQSRGALPLGSSLYRLRSVAVLGLSWSLRVVPVVPVVRALPGLWAPLGCVLELGGAKLKEPAAGGLRRAPKLKAIVRFYLPPMCQWQTSPPWS